MIRLFTPDRAPSEKFLKVLRDAQGIMLHPKQARGGPMVDVSVFEVRTTSRSVQSRLSAAAAQLAPNSAAMAIGPRGALGIAVRRGTSRPSCKRVASLHELAAELAQFALDPADPAPEAAATDYGTEELIRRLYVLLDQKDALLAVFKQAYDDDIETARARIVQLETQLAALEAERLRAAARWRDPKVLGTIAVVIATVLGPVAAVLVDHALHDPVAQVVDQAHDVHVQCSVTPDGDDGLPRTG